MDRGGSMVPALVFSFTILYNKAINNSVNWGLRKNIEYEKSRSDSGKLRCQNFQN